MDSKDSYKAPQYVASWRESIGVASSLASTLEVPDHGELRCGDFPLLGAGRHEGRARSEALAVSGARLQAAFRVRNSQHFCWVSRAWMAVHFCTATARLGSQVRRLLGAQHGSAARRREGSRAGNVHIFRILGMDSKDSY